MSVLNRSTIVLKLVDKQVGEKYASGYVFAFKHVFKRNYGNDVILPAMTSLADNKMEALYHKWEGKENTLVQIGPANVIAAMHIISRLLFEIGNTRWMLL